MNAEIVYKAIKHCIDQDVFPPVFMAGFFGMGGEDLHRVSTILGVWQAMTRSGLLERDAFKQAIREDKIGEFFEQGRLKLASVDHHYALLVEKMNVFFDGLPPLGPEPQQDLVSDTDAAYVYAIDTYTAPHFQTRQTQQAAWDKAEVLLAQLMGQPEVPGAFKVLKMALSFYKEAREIYKMKRKTPGGLAELVRRMQANRRAAATAASEGDSTDSDSSNEAW
jgi:hypothetical protein